jgi:hypothetical protein
VAGSSSVAAGSSSVAAGSSFVAAGSSSVAAGSVANYLVERAWYMFTVMFRPLPWEAHNRFALLASVESVMLLCMSGLILWKIKDIARLLLHEPLFMFALIFMALFTAAFSLQVVNLGTMVRLKINVLPFFFVFVSIAFERCLPTLNRLRHSISSFG